MSFRGAVDVPVEIIGGLVCDTAAVELPPGVSPNCQDADFSEDGARTRPGLGAPVAGTPLGGNVVNYLKTFTTLNGTQRAMAFTDLANLYKESPTGTFSLITGAALPDINIAAPYANSTTQFGKEWLALSDGRYGVGLPRQFDDTNLDRVSQCGPGAGPTVADFLPAPATIGNPGGGSTVNIVASPTGEQAVGLGLNPYPPPKFISKYVVINTTTAHGFSAGQIVTIAGNTGPNPVDGSFTIYSILSSTSFQFAYTMPNSGSVPVNLGGGGTATVGPPATTTISRTANTTTVYTTAAHGFVSGWQVQITGIPAVAIGGAATGTESQGVVTISTATAHGMVVGATAIIAGMSDATYNGTFIVTSVPSPTTFTYVANTTNSSTSGGTVSSPFNGTFTILATPTATSFTYTDYGPNQTSTSGGTATILGSVSPGQHQISVCFVTRQGYITKPSPPVTFNAGGAKMLSVSNIPIGPPNVSQRILLLTQAAGAHFFYLTGVPNLAGSNFVVPDNQTTGLILNFTDGILAGGTLADYLFNLVELGESAGTIDYASRQFWWGERAKVQNLLNLTFDGGFSNPGNTPNYPLGWTPDATFAPGGASCVAQGYPVVWGDAYGIMGDGATATRGKMTQGAYQDYNQVPQIQPNTDYSIRARVARNNTLAAGTLHINLQSTLQSFTTTGLQLAWNGVTTSYVEYTADLTTPLATVPSDLLLQIYADGTPTNNGAFFIDCIEIYPTNQPNNTTIVRASYAENPESFDGVTGLLQPAQNNGQAVRSAFRLRERLYFVKERSLYVTQDDQTNEPASWSIDEVSQKVGTLSVRGVGIGEDWAVIADRNGLYIYWGSEPQKLSQEVGHSAEGLTLAWDQINWVYGNTIWVTVDTKEKRIYVGAPFGSATSPNAILMLDYRKIDPDEGATGAEAIAANGPIRIRYTGMKAVMDKSRKWCPWTPSVNSCALIERPDGTAHVWMGAGSGVPGADKGAIYDLQRANLSDYSTAQAIPFYYWTAFTPQREQNQQIQTHEHRKSFKYLTLMCEGAGLVDLQAAVNNFNTFLSPVSLPSLVLTSPAYGELETNTDVKGERVAFRISSSTPDTASIPAPWMRLTKLTLSVMGDPTTPVRGVN